MKTIKLTQHNNFNTPNNNLNPNQNIGLINHISKLNFKTYEAKRTIQVLFVQLNCYWITDAV